MRIQALTLLATALVSPALAQECPDAQPAIIKGKHFYNSVTGQYIPIKGIAYYPRPNAGLNDMNNVDFFTDEYRHMWERDIAHLVELNVNAVRIYAVDPSQSHDAFMCALKHAGIYVEVGLAASCEGCAISLGKAPLCYPPELKTRGELIINHFAKYDNVISFTAGNEIGLIQDAITDPAWNAPCQKKFIRDMRAYVKSCMASGMRHIPIGLAVADHFLADNSLYYGCRTDPDDEMETAEVYGINQYRDCDGMAQTGAEFTGYQQLLLELKSYKLPMPVIYSEFGCTNPSFPTIGDYQGQRSFKQIELVFTPEYMEEVTGGHVFEYSTEKSNSASPWPFKEVHGGNFGVVYMSPEDCDDLTTPCEVVRFPQFDSLTTAYSQINVVEPPPGDDRPDATECPDNFPTLKSLPWEADEVKSIKCPDLTQHFCPAPANCPTSAPRAPTTDAEFRNDSTMSGVVPVEAPIKDKAAKVSAKVYKAPKQSATTSHAKKTTSETPKGKKAHKGTATTDKTDKKTKGVNKAANSVPIAGVSATNVEKALEAPTVAPTTTSVPTNTAQPTGTSAPPAAIILSPKESTTDRTSTGGATVPINQPSSTSSSTQRPTLKPTRKNVLSQPISTKDGDEATAAELDDATISPSDMSSGMSTDVAGSSMPSDTPTANLDDAPRTRSGATSAEQQSSTEGNSDTASLPGSNNLKNLRGSESSSSISAASHAVILLSCALVGLFM
jgi:1,3-beta-glucanosyltransferase GAS5